MYEFCYDYVKPKQREKVKLCYMDADSFIVHIKTEDIYTDLPRDVETWFDSNGTRTHNHLVCKRTLNTPVSSKEFLDIQANIECRFTLKRVRDMIRTYSHDLIILIIELDRLLPRRKTKR